MKGSRVTRRNFIKGAAAVGALAAVDSAYPFALGALAKKGEARELPHLIPTVCGMCDARCGVLAYVKEGRLLKLEGNFYHSHSLGRICARGSAGVRLLYDPDRLKSPLKRVGDGKFENVSWEQAFQEIGGKLASIRDSHGPQALTWLRRPDLADLWDRQFMRAFGSPNLLSDVTVSHSSRTIACLHTLGGVPVSDLENSRYLLIFGRNFAESIFTADLRALMAAKEKGAKIVVVDPRMTHTAAQAHEWIPIRPGTDGALLLAMMHVIIAEELYDADFVASHTLGFDLLKEYLTDKTPSWAASRCDVPPDTISRLAREFAAAKSACGIDPSWHAAWGCLYMNSVQTARAALALNALVGSYGARGGLLMAAIPTVGAFHPLTTPPIAVPRADGAGTARYPLAMEEHGIAQRLPQIILSEQPYPIKALVVNRSNPARSLPNTAKTLEALKKLDLLVVIDTQMSDTAELAHYVLPESTYLERYDPIAVSTRLLPELALRQPVVGALYDTRPSYEIISALAEAAGLGRYFTFSLVDVIGAQLAPTGLDFDEMKRRGVWRERDAVAYGDPQFGTPSGKIELYLESFQAVGFNPLPAYEPPLVEPTGRNSFRLLHGRDAVHTGTSTQNNAWLNHLAPDNRLWINAQRAAALDIREGDCLRVASAVGEVEAVARVTEAIHPGAVFLAHGYGHDTRAQRLAHGKGTNDSALIPDAVEPISGGAAMCETVVTVSKIRR